MPQNRRNFIKVMGAGSASMVAFPGISILPPFSDQPKSIERTTGKGFTTQKMKTEVVVAGGGVAGICAAIAAARNGAKVILIQNRSRLGGNSSSEIRMHICGANNPQQTRLWRETGIIEELKLTDAVTNPQRSFEMWDLLLYNKVVSEKNITLLLDTAVIDAETKNGKIQKVKTISSLLEEYYEIEAQFFIDCTGDAILAETAGAKYMRGREGKNVYGESLAPDKTDNKTMGNSIIFFSKKYQVPLPFEAPDWARKFTDEDFKHRNTGSWEYGYWWIEWGGELDTIKDNRKIRHELLRIVMGVWDYIKNSGNFPEAENWALDWVGMIPGKRESRRVIGEHVMIQKELEDAEQYFDRVGYGGWPMDDHPPGGIDSKNLKPCQQIYFDEPYNIPLRSLYSINRPNMLMAGRNISASHVAFSSSRVMATCATMGQAAGAAAAFCLKNKCLPKDIVADNSSLKHFQQNLLKDDQSLLTIKNEDENDLARQAKVTASWFTPEGKPGNIIDGWNRNVGDGETHQWQASMSDGDPWIQLEWKQRQIIHHIQLTFDTGLNRRLFLTGNDSVYYDQVRTVQPESVKKYVIEAYVNDKFIPVVRVKNNYVRLKRHFIETIKTNKIRIRVLQTQGDELARLFEIRCYKK
jgi:ribulose 1,5-bisphosphate synthetase/thiazole synthase